MNINRVIITGNLTRDPELRPAGASTVCNMRIASNTRQRTSEGWKDKPNYFDVAVFGAQAEACARHLTRGSSVAVDGQLNWREWRTRDDQRRETVEIIADKIQFLSIVKSAATPAADSASDLSDEPVTVTGSEDDIPF